MTTEREYPFKFAERCLYEYPENRARLERMREDLKRLSSASVQNYNASGKPGTCDPVLSYVLRAGALEERIETLARRTDPISRLAADLESPDVMRDSPKAELARVMRLRYFGKNPPANVARELHLSDRQFRRRKQQLVTLAMKYLGF